MGLVGRWLHPPICRGGVRGGLFCGSFCGLAGFSGFFWCWFGTVLLLNSP